MGANPFQAALLNGGVLPPTQPQPTAQPVQPGTQQDTVTASPDRDQTAAAIQYIMKQAQGIPDTSQLTGPQGLGGVSGDLQKMQQSYADLQPTKRGVQFERVTGPGSLLKDIGRALLIGTGPGRAALSSYDAYKQGNYENQRQYLADQINAVKARQEIPEKELAAKTGLAEGAGNMAYRQGMLGIRNRAEDIRQQAVNNTRDFRNSMIGIDTSKLTEQQRHDKQDEALMAMGVDVQRGRNQVMLTLGDKKISVDESKFDAAQNNKEQGFFDQIGVALGLKQFEGTGGPTVPISSPTPAKPVKGKTSSGKGVTHVWNNGQLQPVGK